MKFLIAYQILIEFWPLILILTLYLFNVISTLQIISLYILYCAYNRVTSNVTVEYDKTNPLLSKILSKCPSITNPTYKPHFFLSYNVLQMLSLNHTTNFKYPQEYTEVVETENVYTTGTSLIHYSYKEIESDPTSPMIIMFPGLTGNHTDRYARNILHEMMLSKFPVLIYQMRMLSKNISLPKETETFSLVEDINITMNYIQSKYPNKKFITVGCSYGANQLVAYLGTYDNPNIIGAVSLSNPYDMLVSSKFCNGTLYDSFLLHLIQKNFRKNFMDINEKLTKYKINKEKVLSCEVAHTFDIEFTSKIMGYKGADSYYRGISCASKIQNIKIPVLYIHAMDDRITTPMAIPYDDIGFNKNSVLVLCERGSHLCYVEMGKNIFEVKQWIPTPTIEFVRALRQNV